jgi:hypothetical protein
MSLKSTPLENPVLHFSSDTFKSAKPRKTKSKPDSNLAEPPSNNSEVDQQRLSELENIIRTGLATFVEVGNALLEIRDSKLYRSSYSTFEEYCHNKWQISRPRAYQLIEAAEIVGNLSTIVDTQSSNNESQVGSSPIGADLPLPKNEAQVRELAGLEPEQQREVWQEATQTAPEGKLTAGHIKQVREKIAAPSPLKDPKMVEQWRLIKQTEKPLSCLIKKIFEKTHPSQHREIYKIISDACLRWLEESENA